MKNIGIILLIIGVIGVLIFGIDAWQQSETFGIAGVEVAVSKANWTPVTVSGVVTLLGIVFLIAGRKK